MSQTYPLALVTGAAVRLGKAFALALARQGYAIGLHYNTSGAAAASAADEIRALGVPVELMQADLTDQAQIDSLFDALDQWIAGRAAPISGLAVLVNSAAVMRRGAAQELPAAEFDAAVDLGLRAPFLCAQLAYRRMGPGSLIVNVTDVAAQKAWSGFPAYTIGKAGLESLTRVLARSFAPRVRVNAIAPGLVLQAPDMPAADWQRLVDRLPLKRSAEPAEITSALEFLLKNEYITGQTIVVDGGYSLL